MAENIDKCYRNGAWGKDTLQDRYDHVMYWLEMHQNGTIDDKDLKWFIKNAVNRRVYMSKAAYALGNKAWKSASQRNGDAAFLADRRGEIDRYGYTAHKNAIELRRWRGNNLIFEHVVPADVYMPILVRLYQDRKLSFDVFDKICNKLHVCIITKEEDRLLNQNHFKTKMPQSIQQFDLLKDNEWGRYEDKDVDIKVHEGFIKKTKQWLLANEDQLTDNEYAIYDGLMGNISRMIIGGQLELVVFIAEALEKEVIHVMAGDESWRDRVNAEPEKQFVVIIDVDNADDRLLTQVSSMIKHIEIDKTDPISNCVFVVMCSDKNRQIPPAIKSVLSPIVWKD